MSHELRTPLNSLLILAEQLGDDPEHTMTETQIQYANVILASGRDLLNLLNGILELAKVESGTVTVESTDVSVGELREGLLREFEQVARGKGLGYSIDLAPGSPEGIVTDPQRLGQILKNLLANAFKFTEHGSVRMKVGLADNGWSTDSESLASAPAVVALSVRDSGIGIPPDQQRRIFEAFAQGDGSTARLYGGTGLGLSISRELVGLLGGELKVDSAPGEGSTFTVYLPMGRRATVTLPAVPSVTPDSPQPPRPVVTIKDWLLDDAAARPPRDPHNGLDDRPFAGTKVLVVDDDFRNVFALTALLERGSAEVTVAESGADAIAALDRMPDINLVLMDIMMPVMDGYAAMRAIRKLDQFKSLAIVAVTGKVVAGERKRCIDAGANDYVSKPVDTAELIAAIGPWLPSAVEPTS
jgi:two-component system chemotaxis sensor kinase CheA